MWLCLYYVFTLNIYGTIKYTSVKSDLGFHSNLFGGKLLAWLDASAAAFAAQCCDTPRMVTVSIDKCIFKRPAKEGQLVKVYGSVVQVNNTSIEFLEARSHNVYNGRQHLFFLQILLL